MTRPPGLDADVLVVGAGIVGLSTARALIRGRPELSVLVVDKEPGVARHQTGHNSGVVHTGIYYAPGSLKASLVARGRQALVQLCRERGLHLDVCGKLIVATDAAEAERLAELGRRAAANGVTATAVRPEQVREIEPHVAGVAALHVPGAAIVDFGEVARAVAADLAPKGEVRVGTAVHALRPDGSAIVADTSAGLIRARAAVNCAGLHADVIAARSGATSDTRIVPFRGEYHELVPSRRHLVRHLVYPVADPRFPFLGVHFTRMVDGSVHAGPNAVLALAREGYRWRDIDHHELRSLARSVGVRRLAAQHWRTGTGEVVRSASRRAMVHALQRLVPEVEGRDLVRAGAGVRAQAVRPDGSLVDDFAIERHGRVVHVLNAPSPAATASLAIGDHIASLVEQSLA